MKNLFSLLIAFVLLPSCYIGDKPCIAENQDMCEPHVEKKLKDFRLYKHTEGSFVMTWGVYSKKVEMMLYYPHTEEQKENDFKYAFDLDCDNDGVFEVTNITSSSSITCNFPESGIYNIAIRGKFPRFVTYNQSQKQQTLLDVVQWGDIIWQDMSYMFYRADFLKSFSAKDVPNLSQVISMKGMFRDTSDFNSDLSSWDVSNVQDMSYMFSGASSFNSDLSIWNVSSVENMKAMFQESSFNRDLSNWNVSNVQDMSSMFSGASSFNSDLSNWDVSSVQDMSYMFSWCDAFNYDLSNWDVSKVTDCRHFGLYEIYGKLPPEFPVNCESMQEE